MNTLPAYTTPEKAEQFQMMIEREKQKQAINATNTKKNIY